MLTCAPTSSAQPPDCTSVHCPRPSSHKSRHLAFPNRPLTTRRFAFVTGLHTPLELVTSSPFCRKFTPRVHPFRAKAVAQAAMEMQNQGPVLKVLNMPVLHTSTSVAHTHATAVCIAFRMWSCLEVATAMWKCCADLEWSPCLEYESLSSPKMYTLLTGWFRDSPPACAHEGSH